MAASAAAHPRSDGNEGQWEDKAQTFRVVLGELNDSGAFSVARLRLEGDQLTIKLRGSGFAPNLVHAQHIHGMGTSECPPADLMPSTFGEQSFLSTSDGAPFYGPIVSSLTTEGGDTSPDAGLSVEIMPVADEKGRIRYERTITLPAEVAENITAFQIVQHGVDFNANGEYDFESAGASDLNEDFPQEATAPANCGTIDDRY